MISAPAGRSTAARSRTARPIRLIGYGIGVLTLIYFMVLTLLPTFGFPPIDCSQRFLAVAVLALGAAMASGFIGGSAKASGDLNIAESVKPVSFAVGGGIAVLVIVLLLGWLLYVRKCAVAPPPPPPEKILAIPAGQTFRRVALAAGVRFGFTVGFRACSEPMLDASVEPGELRASDSRGLLAKIRLRVTSIDLNYTVNEVAKDERYDIVCR